MIKGNKNIAVNRSDMKTVFTRYVVFKKGAKYRQNIKTELFGHFQDGSKWVGSWVQKSNAQIKNP